MNTNESVSAVKHVVRTLKSGDKVRITDTKTGERRSLYVFDAENGQLVFRPFEDGEWMSRRNVVLKDLAIKPVWPDVAARHYRTGKKKWRTVFFVPDHLDVNRV